MNPLTVVYNGKMSVYNIHKPYSIAFPKGVPVTIDSRLEGSLPVTDFETFNKKKHPRPKTPVKPILIKLPQVLHHMIPCLPILYSLREFFPYTPIIACYKEQFDFLVKISDCETVETYAPNPINHYKELNCKIPKDSPVFNGGALFKHTWECCFRQLLKYYYLKDKENHNKPTLLKHNGKPEHITIINHGSKGNVWDDFGKFLAKQNWNHPVKMIDKELSLKKSYEIIKNSLYVIATGDSSLSLLTAYLGIPVFIFARNTQDVLIHQLNHFNNISKDSVIYSPFRFDKSFDKIFKGDENPGLKQVVKSVLAGKPVMENYKPKPPVTIPKQDVTRIEGIG